MGEAMTSDQLQKAAREAAEKFSRAVWKGGSREFRNGRIDTREDFKAGYLAAAEPREKKIEELLAKLEAVPVTAMRELDEWELGFEYPCEAAAIISEWLAGLK